MPPFGPPPPPGAGRLPGEDPDEFDTRRTRDRKSYKNRDAEENRRVLKWLVSTGREHLPSVMVMVAFSVVSSLASVVFALVSQHAVDSAVQKDMRGVVIFAVCLALVGIAQILIRAFDNYWTERVSAKVENSYRSRLFDAILTRDFSQVTSYHSGELMNRLTEDVNIIVTGVTGFLPSIAEIITNLVGAGSVLLLTDWRFCLIYILATVALIVVNRVYRHAIKRYSTLVRVRDGESRSFFQDAISSLLVLRVFVTEQNARKQSQERLQNFYSARIDRSKVRIKSNSIMGLSMNFGHIFSLVWCSFQLIFGTMTYGSMVAIMQLTGQVRMPFISASNLSSQYYSMIASGLRIMEIEDLAQDMTPEEKQLMDSGFDARKCYESLTSLKGEELTFSYGPDPVLRHVDFSFEKGDVVSIMGQSGCGKSTLFKLILGMFHPNSGSVSLYGTGKPPANAQTCGDGWRAKCGPTTRRLFAYVPQGNLLISGRLRDSVAFGRPSASDEEVWDALRLACADGFVKNLPEGLDTVLGEHGSGLSEGQIQRLAVARAYLSDAPILLLDEATSSLDEGTEAQLLQNLKALKDRTIIIVTHRRAALSICDKHLDLQNR